MQRRSVTFPRTHGHAIHLICISKLDIVYQDHEINILYRCFKAWVFMAQTATTNRFHHWPTIGHNS